MVQGELATQDLCQTDQDVCGCVRRGAGQVLVAATRRLAAYVRENRPGHNVNVQCNLHAQACARQMVEVMNMHRSVSLHFVCTRTSRAVILGALIQLIHD